MQECSILPQRSTSRDNCLLNFTMPELRGRALLLTISLLTSLGFMLIGYDNGLMGGLVGAPAFNKTFDYPSSNMIGTIVAIFESELPQS